jgi:hypothetical protein
MVAPFPANLLGIKVELMINTTWTDISSYVYQRNPILITNMGRPDESSGMQSAQVTLTLNNIGGRFSPEQTTGPYYPYIQRNMQIRISINSESSTLVTYSGYRFWGEVIVLPNAWDPTNHDVYADITASGIWRRISQSTITIGSPFRRYYTITVGTANGLTAYWPMEDGSGSLTFVSYVPGEANGTWGTQAPSLGGSSAFLGSDAIPTLNGSSSVFNVTGASSSINVVRFLLSVPINGDSNAGSPPANWNVVEIDTPGTIAKLEVYSLNTGSLEIEGKNSSGTNVFTGTTATNVRGKPVLVSAELHVSGSTVTWYLYLITPGAASITETLTGTFSGSLGSISQIKVSRANILYDTAVGHLAVLSTSPSMITAAYALNGYIGEYAITRFTRLCTEMGIAYETIGTASSSAALGPQVDATPGNAFQLIETSDGGLLYETKDQFGLGYRCMTSMQSQSVAVTYNYTASTIMPTLTPTWDDLLIHNDIIVVNYDGYSIEAILTVGAVSIQNPPNGVGTGYQQTVSVSLAADSQVSPLAAHLLGVGTVAGERYPVVSIDMSRPQVAALFASIPGLRIGDYIQITNPLYVTSPVRQLVWGYNETINARTWTFDFNTVAEAPWETGYSPGTVSSNQVSGSASTSLSSVSESSIAALLQNGLLGWPSLVSAITQVTPAGNRITLSTTAPSNPNNGDQWINTTTGVISIWNSTTSTWVAVSFNASDVIQAETITAAQILAATITATQIAADTITAANLVSNIVVAGIVNGTTIESVTFIAGGGGGTTWPAATPSTPGYFMYYDSGVGNPTLVFSATAAAGSDQWGNSWQGGATFVGLPGVLPNTLSVLDTSGDKLAGIDSSGNIVGKTVSASTDVIIAGNSTLVQLGALPEGVISRGWTPLGPWPSTPIANSETALFELDVTVPAGRTYALKIFPADFIMTTAPSSSTQFVLTARYTSDGSTPTTSSPMINSNNACITEMISGAALNNMSPYLEWLIPATSTLEYRVLISAYVQSGAFQFKNRLEARWEDLGANAAELSVNNAVLFGSGTSGGSGGTQTYTETFYPSETWSYYASGSLRETNGILYHGYYGDPSNWEYSYIQWAAGSLGHNLNTVLGYTVNWVTLRVTNLHTWYDNGMTFGIHSSTTLGGGIGTYSVLLASEFISEGNTYNYTIGSGVWSPFAAGGTTYMVLGPDSGDTTNYAWYGYFTGGTSGNCPRIQVNYTH